MYRMRNIGGLLFRGEDKLCLRYVIFEMFEGYWKCLVSRWKYRFVLLESIEDFRF